MLLHQGANAEHRVRAHAEIANGAEAEPRGGLDWAVMGAQFVCFDGVSLRDTVQSSLGGIAASASQASRSVRSLRALRQKAPLSDHQPSAPICCL